MRPLIKPSLQRVWRDATTLQIGLDPERALVITGVDAGVARLVGSLDGTRELGDVLSAARAAGLSEDAARDVVELLLRGGVLDDAAADAPCLSTLPSDDRERLAPDLASLSLSPGRVDGGAGILGRRRAAAVAVHGGGRIGTSVACLLAAAGVGCVVVVDDARVTAADLSPAGLRRRDVGSVRALAARDAVRRVALATRTTLRDTRLDLAVLAPVAGPPHPRLVDDLMRAGVLHLAVTVRERTAVVGPMVLPATSACLRCLDLHRCDRDPSWPRVAAQLVAGRMPLAACEVTLATLAAAQAAQQALLLLDGESHPPSVGGTLETTAADGRTRRRSWDLHPACGCQW